MAAVSRIPTVHLSEFGTSKIDSRIGPESDQSICFLGVPTYIRVQEANDKTEAFPFCHFRSLQRAFVGNAVNRLHTGMPGVFNIGLEGGPF
jgi:hypothetical protein